MAIAFVQADTGTTSIADGGTVSFPGNVSSGSLLLATIAIPSATVTVDGLTDSLGNTWQRAVQSGVAVSRRNEIWYAHCPTGGACTVTVNWSGAQNSFIRLHEYSGFPAGVTLDQTNHVENGTNTQIHSAGDITTTEDEAVITAVFQFDGNFTISARLTDWQALTVFGRSDHSYKITSATETTDGEVQTSGLSRGPSAIASFYPTSAGGEITGTLDVALGAATLEGSGVVGDPPVEGTLGVTLDAVTLAGTGTITAGLTHLMGVGGVTDGSATYRSRADGDATLKIEYSTASDLSGSTTSAGVAVDSSTDYTGGETITGLSADTVYYYRILVDDAPAHSSPYPQFKTFPAEGVDADVVIAFGSCQTSATEADIFASIAAETPDLFLHLGDFGYPDSTVLATQRSNYQDQYASDFLAEIVRKFPREHVWDDHDYGPNNSTGDTGNKANSLQAFKEYVPTGTLANPTNGIWRKVSIANVDIFMLDTRYNREGTKVRFPTTAGTTNTADTGSSGTTLVLRSADSPSGANDNYNGWYVEVEGVVRRITDYVGATRTATLSASVPGLDDASTYYLRKASILDQDFIASDQVDWLISEMTASTARWKLLVTSSMWNPTFTSQPTAEDSWGGWDVDRVEQKYLIQELSGVLNLIVLSGDRHVSAVDDGTNSGWPELSASPLNNNNASATGSTWSNGLYDAGHAYGLLTISGSAHTATLNVKDVNGTTATGITPLVVDADASEVSGSLNITLGTLTATATATAEVQGSTDATLGTLTTTATATVEIAGALGVTLGAATMTGEGVVGNVPVEGTLTVTLSAVTSTATGTVAVSGSTAVTLGALSLAGTATVPAVGSALLTLSAASLAAAGTVSDVPDVTSVVALVGSYDPVIALTGSVE